MIEQGLAARGFAADVPADMHHAQADDIVRRVEAAVAGRMAGAQVARDQFMAQQVLADAVRGVVLLAGNGHLLKGIGVPRWLPLAAHARAG